jgi:hypothetical protein
MIVAESNVEVRETASPKPGVVIIIDGKEFFLNREQAINLCISLASPVKTWGWYKEKEGFERHMPDDWEFLKEGDILERGDQYGIGMNFQVGEGYGSGAESSPPSFTEGRVVTQKMLTAFPRRRRKICQTCSRNFGKSRIDHGAFCGVHCDDCFQKMLNEARSKSW